MCFSSSASLAAWIISIVIAVYLWCRNKRYDRWNAAFITSFSTIQLLESKMWNVIDAKNDPSSDYNSSRLDIAGEELNVLTKLVMITLLTQPLVQNWMGWKYTSADTLGMLTMVYAVILIYNIFSKGYFYTTVVGEKGHLVWKRYEADASSSGGVTGGNSGRYGVEVPFLGSGLTGVLYLFGLFVPLTFMEGQQKWWLLGTGVLTALYAAVCAGPGEFGSYWCYTAVAYSVIALVM